MGDIFWKTVAESAIWSDVLNKVGDNAVSRNCSTFFFDLWFMVYLP